MNKTSTQNREQAVRLIAQRDSLQQSVADWELQIHRLDKEIEVAENVNDEALVKRLRSEQADYEDLLSVATESLSAVLQEIEILKAEIWKEQETHRRVITSGVFPYKSNLISVLILREIERLRANRELTVSGDEKR